MDGPALMGLIVIEPGLSTTVQDGGRPGYREWGVPLGGAFDRGSAGLANALVGNPPGCAVLEMTLIGGIYQADGPLALAMAGAPMEARVVSPDGRNELDPASRRASRSAMGNGSSWAGLCRGAGRTWRSKEDGKPASPGQPVVGRTPPGRRRAARRAGVDPDTPSREPVWRSPTAEPFRIIAGPDGRFGIRRSDDRLLVGPPVSGRLAAATGWACGWRASPFRSSRRPSGSRPRSPRVPSRWPGVN